MSIVFWISVNRAFGPYVITITKGGKSMRKQRHNYTPVEKVSILSRHLVAHVVVSDLCDEYRLQPKLAEAIY